MKPADHMKQTRQTADWIKRNAEQAVQKDPPKQTRRKAKPKPVEPQE